jgi:hypothetical protein
MKKPSSYLFPCKNNGRCRQLKFEEWGMKWNTYAHDYGSVNIFQDSAYGDWDNKIASFKCCTQCHLPINQVEATRINRLLGYELTEVEVDDDFLELLNDF